MVDEREHSPPIPAAALVNCAAGLARNSGHLGAWRRAPRACVTPQSGAHERVMFWVVGLTSEACAALVRPIRLNHCVVGLMIKARQPSEHGLVQDLHHDDHSTHHHQTVL